LTNKPIKQIFIDNICLKNTSFCQDNKTNATKYIQVKKRYSQTHLQATQTCKKNPRQMTKRQMRERKVEGITSVAVAQLL